MKIAVRYYTRGRPNKDDCAAAGAFAKKIVSQGA